MNVRIHFFSERNSNISLKRIYDFFDDESYIYSQHQNYIAFRYENKVLNNRASFVFAKRNVIPEIYRLNSGFKNLNLFVEFPLIISNFYLDEIMKIVDQFSKMFDLFYYLDLNQDILPFDKDKLFNQILDYRDRTISFEDVERTRGKFLVDPNMLHEICSYQLDSDMLSEYFSGDVDVNKYIVMKNLETDELCLSVVWDASRPTIFPKHINYIHIIFDETELPSIVAAKDILPKINRFLALLPNFVDGTRILKPGSFIKKASRVQNKIRNSVLNEEDFQIIQLSELLDERNVVNE